MSKSNLLNLRAKTCIFIVVVPAFNSPLAQAVVPMLAQGRLGISCTPQNCFTDLGRFSVHFTVILNHITIKNSSPIILVCCSSITRSSSLEDSSVVIYLDKTSKQEIFFLIPTLQDFFFMSPRGRSSGQRQAEESSKAFNVI